MRTVVVALFAFTLAAVAIASEPTFKITTTKGKTVEVTAEALKASYSEMVNTTFNGTYKNEDGSTSIVRPAVIIAGQAHLVGGGAFDGVLSAKGLCVLRGFPTLITSEAMGGLVSGPLVILQTDGSAYSTYEGGPVGSLYAFRSITCR